MHDPCMTTRAGRSASALRRLFPQGVARVQHLVDVGISERTVYKRCLHGGPWQWILPGVVLLFTGRPSRDQVVHAALLLAGPDAVLTGLEACRRYGLRRGPTYLREVESAGEVHVLVPADRQLRTVEFVHVERTIRLPPGVQRDGIPLAPASRACTDAARRIRDRGDVTELFAQAVQRRLCTIAQLSTELALGSRRGTAVPRAVLRDMSDGIRSAAEGAAKMLWREAGLPTPWWNAAVYDANGRLLGVADCWLDDVAMVWEIESTEWHLSPAEHSRTVERAARLVASGAVYTAAKPRKILDDPGDVIAILRATYRQALARRRPPLRARPVSLGEAPPPVVQESHIHAR